MPRKNTEQPQNKPEKPVPYQWRSQNKQIAEPQVTTTAEIKQALEYEKTPELAAKSHNKLESVIRGQHKFFN